MTPGEPLAGVPSFGADFNPFSSFLLVSAGADTTSLPIL